jgi:undecaprenyl-diphosphatase
MYDYFCAVILGIVEGLTEFLPISSTGHLILVRHLLGVEGPVWETFDIMIQLGAILAVVVLYFQRLWTVLMRLPHDPSARQFALLLLIALAPSLILGAIFGSTIKYHLFNPVTVGTTLILGGFIILAVEFTQRTVRFREVEEIPLLTALWIGLVQTVSMVPGTSRSGATIIGSLLLGLDRRTATEFSFFLAIPTMLAAFTYEAYKGRDTLDFSGAGIIAVGFVVSFLAALAIIKPFLNFVSRVGFAPFAYYRIALGTLVLTLMAF